MTPATQQHALGDAAEALVQELKRVSGELHSPQRVTTEVEAIDPLAWLASQQSNTKLYWQSRDGSTEVAAVGSAHALRGQTADELHNAMFMIDRSLSDSVPGMYYLGGVRFDIGFPAGRFEDSWHPYDGFHFVLPQLELVRSGNRFDLAANIHPARWFPSAPETVARLRAYSRTPGRIADHAVSLTGRSDTPDEKTWQAQVTALLDRFTSSDLAKVVLARRSRCSAGGTINPWRLLSALREHTSRCTLFAFQFDGKSAFVGATPERLYRRDGQRLRSEAVAGTRARGENTQRDEELESKLRRSDKEQREHNFVVQSVTGNLAEHCDSVTADAEPHVLKLSRVQHLQTNITAVVRADTTDADLLMALHPTAAVNGHPRDAAMKAIRDTETFDRGWYAGPVGRVGAHDAEFAVAIRSALINGPTVDLFSGAGIVSGSNPEHEWRELEKKLSTFLGALGNTSGG